MRGGSLSRVKDKIILGASGADDNLRGYTCRLARAAPPQ
ncbi:MAG: hypothetical protein QOD56_120 [Gammaproteobacteria bacterium]|jgi:hypothetical protein|nr:hypothetical protein [Gammaproteobacteria bacterium]